MNNINAIENLVEKFEQKKMTRRELVASLLVACCIDRAFSFRTDGITRRYWQIDEPCFALGE